MLSTHFPLEVPVAPTSLLCSYVVRATPSLQTLVVCLLLLAAASGPVAGQETVEFWWDGAHWEATTQEEWQQLLAIIPNASGEAQLALAEIGVPDFEYYGYSPDLGLFSRPVASGTPPIGGSTRDLITALAEIPSSSQLFWTTELYSGCAILMPWPYVEVEVEAGTTSAQVYQLALQSGGSVHAWTGDTTVVLKGNARSVFDLIDFANGLLTSPFVVTSEPMMTWSYCGCGCPSGDPTTGGGPSIPPASGGPPSVLEIPTLDRLALLLLGLVLGALGIRRLR